MIDVTRIRLLLAVDLLYEGTAALFAIGGLLLVPMIAVVIYCAMTLYLFAGCVYLMSSGEVVTHSDPEYITIELQLSAQLLTAFLFQMWLWSTFFLEDVCNLIVAHRVAAAFRGQPDINGSILQQMQSQDGDDAPDREWFLSSASHVLSHHLGSAALGSLLPMRSRSLRMLLQFLSAHTDFSAIGSSGPVHQTVQWLQHRLRPCFRYSSENAYVQVAITGQDLLTSGHVAYSLLIRNLGHAVSMVGAYTNFASWMLKVYVAMVCAAVAWCIFDYYVEGDVFGYVSPTAFVFLSAYGIASIFFGTAVTAVDTLLHLYAMDEEHDFGCGARRFPEVHAHLQEHLDMLRLDSSGGAGGPGDEPNWLPVDLLDDDDGDDGRSGESSAGGDDATVNSGDVLDHEAAEAQYYREKEIMREVGAGRKTHVRSVEQAAQV